MLGKNILKKKTISYRRQYFIKDLFNNKEVMNNFRIIECSSINSFSKLITDYLSYTGQSIIVNVDSANEFVMLKQIILGHVGILNKIKLIFHCSDLNLLFDNGLSELMHSNISVRITTPVNLYSFVSDKKKAEWIQKHVIYFYFRFNKENMAEINQIGFNFMTNMLRFLWLDFDIISLNDLKLDEVQNLEFWINFISNWKKATSEKGLKGIQVKTVNKFMLKCYVDDELNVKYDKYCNESVFSLLDERNGEGMGHKELSKIREWIDLTPEIINTPFNVKMNWLFFDPWANKKIAFSINEIPVIVGLINTWMGLIK